MKANSILAIALAASATVYSSLPRWGVGQLFKPSKRSIERKENERVERETIAKAEAKRLRKQQKRIKEMSNVA